ncbi:MAG TPA: hypothetical protein VMF62_08275 [Acetobacteraceae bacterium]|jgi:hypothetical protein|nr:hypothetical protein [Acetobacteraceae bacterium]
MHGRLFVARAAVALSLLLGLSFAAPARAEPCCGRITPDGQRLAALLDRSGVEHLWQPHVHIDWLTGEPDPDRPGWSPNATHCSSYAAAMADRMGVYLLRPPEHGQDLLANAQFRWLEGQGEEAGWKEVDAKTAQSLANQGSLVVAVYENPDPGRPGHIAVIRPSEKTPAALEAEGPEEAQAGRHNALSIPVAQGFAGHDGGWEPGGTGGLRFFAHAVDWARLPQ